MLQYANDVDQNNDTLEYGDELNDLQRKKLETQLKNHMGTDKVIPYIIPKDVRFDDYSGKALTDDNVGNGSNEDNKNKLSGEFIPYDNAYLTWVRWDAFSQMLNNTCLPIDEKGRTLFSFNTLDIINEEGEKAKLAPLRYTAITPQKVDDKIKVIKYPSAEKWWQKAQKTTREIQWNLLDMSCDQAIVRMPHMMVQDYQKTTELTSMFEPHANILINTSPKSNLKISNYNTYSDETRYNIGAIYLCVDGMLHTFRDMYFDQDGEVKDDFSLFKFVKKIWENVNSATSGNHNFELNVSHKRTSIIRVVDMQAQTEKELDLSSIFELPIQSPDSVCRNIAYNTQLPSELTATIAIAAQAPDSIDDLDQVTWAALNKGIRDRFAKPTDGSTDEPTEPEKKRWKRRFNRKLKTLWSCLGASQGWLDGYFLKAWGNGLGTIPGLWYNTIARGSSHYSATLYADGETSSNHEGSDSSQYNMDTDYSISAAPEKLQEFISANKSITSCINYFNRVYGKDDPNGKYFQGQPRPNPPRTVSSIIPLQFNAKLDGIGGLIIGNVFKIVKDKLPKAYRAKDVHFIIFKESQNITSGQDWTTTISGHLVLLGDEKGRVADGAENSYLQTYTIPEGEEDAASEGEEKKKKKKSPYKKKNLDVNTNCSTVTNRNNDHDSLRHEIEGDVCSKTSEIELMDKLIPKLKADGFNKPIVVAAGITANVYHESSYWSAICGDGGQSAGLVQWNKTRWDDLKEFSGNGFWTDPDIQLNFILYEMKNKESNTGRYLKTLNNDGSPHEIASNIKSSSEAKIAGAIFMMEYERPQDQQGIAQNSRGNTAQQIYENYMQRNPSPEKPLEQTWEKAYADRLFKAGPDKYGTDEEEFEAVMTELTYEQRLDVRAYWDKNRTSYGGKTLKEMFNDELSGDWLDKILSYLDPPNANSEVYKEGEIKPILSPPPTNSIIEDSINSGII